MSTHIHLAVLSRRLALGELFESVHTAFAGWFRAREGGLGSVFAGRFKTILFEPELAGILIPYIHNNEVRASLVPDPALSRWSSHRAYRGERPAPDWLRVELGLELCGFDVTAAGRRGFDEWVRLRSSDPKLETFGRATDTDDRYAELGECGIPVGPRSALPLSRPPIVQPSAQAWTGSAEDLLDVGAGVFGVTVPELVSKQRYSPLSRARAAIALAWTRDLGRPQADVAAAMHLTSSAVSRACRRAREDSVLSARASQLADMCRRGRLLSSVS